jgi:hypothetical protein
VICRFRWRPRQPVGDKYVHSATRCAWWQTTQFCPALYLLHARGFLGSLAGKTRYQKHAHACVYFGTGKIAAAGLQRIIAVGNYAPRKLPKAISWPGSQAATQNYDRLVIAGNCQWQLPAR